MNDKSGQEFGDLRPPESYTDKELIEQSTRSVKAVLSSATIDDYQGLDLMGITSFNGVYEQLDPQHTEALKAITSDYPLIDLGGNNGWSKELLDKFGITDYTIVDVQSGADIDQPGLRIQHANMDLLEYMRQVPDGVHANVTSNGVLMGDWYAAAHPEWHRGDPRREHNVALEQEYLRRLFKHIHRVLPEDGVFMAKPFDFDYLVQAQGLLVRDENLTVRHTADGITSIDLPVYRKTPTSIHQ